MSARDELVLTLRRKSDGEVLFEAVLGERRPTQTRATLQRFWTATVPKGAAVPPAPWRPYERQRPGLACTCGHPRCVYNLAG